LKYLSYDFSIGNYIGLKLEVFGETLGIFELGDFQNHRDLLGFLSVIGIVFSSPFILFY